MDDSPEEKGKILNEVGKGNAAGGGVLSLPETKNEESSGSEAVTSSASTSGEDKSVGETGASGDSGTSPPSTSIKKRSSNASQRNYRSSQAHLSGNSDDSDDEADSSSSKSSKKMRNDADKKESTSMETSSDNGTARESASVVGPSNNEESNDSNDWAMAIGIDSPRFSPTRDDDDDAPRSSLQRLLYRVRDVGHSDDDQVQFEEVRPESDSSSNSPRRRSGLEESSSDTSDCVLEDLDETEPNAESSKAAEPSGDRPTTGPSSKKPGGTPKAPKKKHETPKVLLKPKPKYDWTGPLEIKQRELGYGCRKFAQSAQLFRSRFYGSLYSAERLELWQKLDGHHGCVNCLNFSYDGTKLASGSDDLFIKIWNYGMGKSIASFHSGHRANVFQAKFLPLVSLDTMIVSCARDCQVRLSELNATGQVWCSRKLAQHRGPAHKLSVSPETPHVVFSAGEDGVVFSIDIREDKAQRILTVKEGAKKIDLYSIHQNPVCGHEFCVSGRDEYIRIYDTRKLSTSSTTPNARSNEDAREHVEVSPSPSPLKKFCPHHLSDNRHRPNVTAAVYNYNGREIVASYNDENIYLFDATLSDGADCIKMYEGHRNSATIKGINFFGDKSQFVVSGSDCGHIFLWDKETECIVNFLRGDENGVVNCLEPHPLAPILATSGLDDDVKIWIPTKEKDPLMGPNNLDLSSTVHKNIKSRTEELERQPESMDGRIIQALWNHIRQANRERRREQGLQLSDSDDSTGMDDDDDDDDTPRGVECRVA